MLTVEFEGKTIKTNQEPFIDGMSDEKPIYKAYGEDQEGNEYIITWNVVDHYEEIEDESEMCNWDKPSGLMKL